MTEMQTIQNGYVNGALLEKVIIQNDLAGLASIEKVKYVNTICESLKLNPLTKPIQLIKFQGKEIAYFSKDATEQLRKINHVSLKITETKIIDDIYLVVTEASTPDGRIDSATGAVSISGLKGDAKANAMMKAETKSKRRATLSICGLGLMDESEIESLPNAKPVHLEVNVPELISIEKIDSIENAETLEELEEVYKSHYKQLAINRDKESLKKLIEAKDKRKAELEVIDNSVFDEFAKEMES